MLSRRHSLERITFDQNGRLRPRKTKTLRLHKHVAMFVAPETYFLVLAHGIGANHSRDGSIAWYKLESTACSPPRPGTRR